MPEAPRLTFPHRRSDPRRSLLQRVGVSFAIVGVIALITYIGRKGYHDAAGGPISLLDAFYYATVTATTTGYGDIAPYSPPARAVTAFVVTPLRILFLIVLVGTTIELLTERFRQARAERRWRRRVRDHTIVAGYGTTGRGAVEAMIADGATDREAIVVIDNQPAAVAAAGDAGLTAILADATHTVAWRQAAIDTASAVVVTCHRDDTAALATLTARELNRRIPIAAAVREGENAHLLVQSGATTVVLSSEAAGRLIGLSTTAPAAVSVLEDLMLGGSGLDLVERTVSPYEVGAPPRSDAGAGIPIAIIRGGVRLSFADEAFQRLQAGDTVVSLRGGRAGVADSVPDS